MPTADRSYVDRNQPATVRDSRWSDTPRPGLRPILASGVALLDPAIVLPAVEQAFQLPAGTLVSRDRTRNVAEARDAASWLLRRHSRLSFPQLAEALGRRNHTAVLMAVRRADERRAEDAWFRDTTDQLERELVAKAGQVRA